MQPHGGISLDLLLHVVDSPASKPSLQRYFAAFTGRWFNALGSTDTAATENTVTATDLIALQTLRVDIPLTTKIDLLEGSLGRDLSELLMAIPASLDLGDPASREHIVNGSPADRAWNLLTKCADGVGWVIAGKLLARKRPRLIPVYDDVVRCALGHPSMYWNWLHNRLVDRDGILDERLDTIRASAAIPVTTSRLRTLDIIMWMRHRPTHTSRECKGLD